MHQIIHGSRAPGTRGGAFDLGDLGRDRGTLGDAQREAPASHSGNPGGHPSPGLVSFHQVLDPASPGSQAVSPRRAPAVPTMVKRRKTQARADQAVEEAPALADQSTPVERAFTKAAEACDPTLTPEAQAAPQYPPPNPPPTDRPVRVYADGEQG